MIEKKALESKETDREKEACMEIASILNRDYEYFMTQKQENASKPSNGFRSSTSG